MSDPIALAVPVFFLLIAGELALAARRRRSVYRFADAVTDLSCGITSQIALLGWGALQLGIYGWVFEHGALVRWPNAWLPWVVALVGVDFLYYWWHRLSHEVNVLWAAHVVHHQSEDFNLAVALRQPALTSWTALPFYLVLAVLGVPPLAYAAAVAVSMLYQFWIHTELVGPSRGILARVLNLPTHHRVHHAVNPAYLDKNHGAILIVWDRVFGTYAEETEPPVYGLTKPFESFDPLWAQVHGWVELAGHARRAPGVVAKLGVWFSSPARTGASVPESVPARLARAKYDRPQTSATKLYVGLHYAVLVLATFALMMWHAHVHAVTLALGSAAVLGGVWAIGARLEGKRWARAAEVARLATTALAVLAWMRDV